MTEKKIPNPCIQTFSGRMMNIFDPTPDMIDINDIAHALPMLARWNGQVRTFYSVAAHSIQVCNRIKYMEGDETAQLQGLLHDASEAYLSDIPSPIKKQLGQVNQAELKLQQAIFEKFNLPWPMHDLVHEADTDCLIHEAKELFVRKHDWVKEYPISQRYDYVTGCVENPLTSPSTKKHAINFDAVRERFMHRFYELGGGIR
jgi:5'-deoxynucleotidase YfbR-like HD superfamily hydrolase